MDAIVYIVFSISCSILKFFWNLLKVTGLHIPLIALLLISLSKDGVLPEQAATIGVIIFCGWVIYEIYRLVKFVVRTIKEIGK